MGGARWQLRPQHVGLRVVRQHETLDTRGPILMNRPEKADGLLPGAEGGRGASWRRRPSRQAPAAERAMLIMHFPWVDSTMFFSKSAFKGARRKQQRGKRRPGHSSLLPKRPEAQQPVSPGAKTQAAPLAGQWSAPGFLTQGGVRGTPGQGTRGHMSLGQKAETENRSNIVTNSVKALETVHIKTS